MMKQEDLLKKLKEHQPIIVNYGKPIIVNHDGRKFEDVDIKETAIWDDKQNAYISETGIWDTRLLIEIARGEVKDTSIEKVGE